MALEHDCVDSNSTLENMEVFSIPDNATIRLFALVIGIDDYQNMRKLRGAASDADKVAAYLRQYLRVPREQIINLRDKDATGKGIIDAFRYLRQNPNISPQDAILIYFAGHGREVTADEWGAGGEKTQVILPQDAGREASFGKDVHTIPHLTITPLLDELAREKGDNITVVLDCCHSGMPQNCYVPGYDTRNECALQVDLPPNLDWDIVRPRAVEDQDGARDMIITAGSLKTEPRSYVLLAACAADELAWENRGGGAFTATLLETLKRIGSDDKVTYTSLIQQLPILPN